VKNKIVLCILAAAVFGAVFLSEPVPALAASAEQVYVDEGVPAVEGWGSENYSDSHYAVWTNCLEASQKLCIEWSLKSDFTLENGYLTLDGTAGEYCLSKHFQKGHTYYVRAYIMETAKVSNRRGGWEEVKRYGPYSRTVVMEQRAPEAEAVDFTVEENSVTMRLESAEPATGFEIQRAEGAGKYKRIAKISDNVYTDTGLSEGKTYRYRIRTFVFEPKTRLTAYGTWKSYRATTWGQEMQVKAVPSGSKAVKVTWNRVPGATGYRIYRAAGISRTQSVMKGKKGGYRSLRLLKTIKSPTSRTYKDTKVRAGETYTYFVTAYREGKTAAQALKTYVLQGTDSVTLDFEKLEVIRKRRRPDGSVRLTWKKKHGVDGYLLKKRNPDTGTYEKYKRLSGQAGACVFPAADPGMTDQYLLYAYRGNVFSNGVEVSTSGSSLGKTENIQAYATVDGQGVQISWSRVPGASFYKVYRSRSLAAYDGDMDSYDFKGGDTVKVIKAVGEGVTDEIYATYAVDQRLELTAGNTATLLNQGPEQGLVYYYYVQAFRSDGSRVTGAALHGKPARVLLNMYFPRPAITSAKSTAKGRIAVKWNSVKGAKKYFVYRAEKKGGDYVLAGKTTKTDFTDKKLTPGKKYYYRVKAYRPNAVGADLYSEASKAWGAVAQGGR
jgi:fibronectin type 3 domain-containing protein